MPTQEQLKPLIEALTAYKQDQQTLQPVVDTALTIYGQDWTTALANDLENLQNVDTTTLTFLKEKANHAIYYYGALTAWEEAHHYLNSTNPIDPNLLKERLPILEYWLSLFGDEGNKVNGKLKQLFVNISPVQPGETSSLSSETLKGDSDISADNQETSSIQQLHDARSEVEPVAEMTSSFETSDSSSPAVKLEEKESLPQSSLSEESAPFYPANISEDTRLSEEDILETTAYSSQPELGNIENQEENTSFPVQEEPDSEYPLEEQNTSFNETEPLEDELIETSEQPTVSVPEIVQEDLNVVPSQEISEKGDSSKNWEINNYLKEKELYEQVVAWVTAKCIRMGNIELTAYPHYGFIVDLMQSLKENIQNLLSNPLLTEIIETQLKEGRKGLEGFLKVLETELAHLPEIESQPSDAIIEGIDARSILGQIDTSNKKEYLGPAPDGFELIEDPYEKKEDIAKEDLLKAYEKAEEDTGDSINHLNILEEETSQSQETQTTPRKG